MRDDQGIGFALMIDTVPLQEIRCLAHIGSRETDSGDIGERRCLSLQVARDPAAIDHPDLAGREPEEKAVPGLRLDTETAAKTDRIAVKAMVREALGDAPLGGEERR